MKQFCARRAARAHMRGLRKEQNEDKAGKLLNCLESEALHIRQANGTNNVRFEKILRFLSHYFAYSHSRAHRLDSYA